MIFAANQEGLIILGIILGFFAAVALIAFIVYRVTHPKLKNEKPTEEQVLKEEMDRVLKPIEDEKIAEEISKYKDENDEE